MSLCMNYHLEKSDYSEVPLHVRVAHDRREIKTKSSVFKSENNDFFECEELSKLKNMNDYKEFFQNESERLDKLVYEKIKQKNQTKLNIIEGVLSISREDYEKINIKETIEKLKKYYQKEGVKVYSITFHDDEGHINDVTKKMERNYHFHILHSNIDENGKSFTKRKFKARDGLSLVQDELSEVIGIDRGEKKSQSKRKHINHKEYKEMKKRESEELLKECEKIKKISNLELIEKINLINNFDIDIERFLFIPVESYYHVTKENMLKIVNFHKYMIKSYQEVNEYNTLMTILKTKLEKVKDIKDLEKLEKETQNIKQNLEILEPYHKELSEKIEKQKKEFEQYETLKSEVQRLETQKNTLKSEVFDLVGSKNTLESELLSINKKIVSQSQTQSKLQNELETLERVNPQIKEFSKKLQEEEKQKQKNSEKFQEEQRQRQYWQQQQEPQHTPGPKFKH